MVNTHKATVDPVNQEQPINANLNPGINQDSQERIERLFRIEYDELTDWMSLSFTSDIYLKKRAELANALRELGYFFSDELSEERTIDCLLIQLADYIMRGAAKDNFRWGNYILSVLEAHLLQPEPTSIELVLLEDYWDDTGFYDYDEEHYGHHGSNL